MSLPSRWMPWASDYIMSAIICRPCASCDRQSNSIPDHGPAQVHLGMALYARRNYEDAVVALEKGIEHSGRRLLVSSISTRLGSDTFTKIRPNATRPQKWLLIALEIDPETGPALEGMALCANKR